MYVIKESIVDETRKVSLHTDKSKSYFALIVDGCQILSTTSCEKAMTAFNTAVGTCMVFGKDYDALFGNRDKFLSSDQFNERLGVLEMPRLWERSEK